MFSSYFGSIQKNEKFYQRYLALLLTRLYLAEEDFITAVVMSSYSREDTGRLFKDHDGRSSGSRLIIIIMVLKYLNLNNH